MNMKARNIDFVCVGFPKCGTTMLYGVLKQHPQISLARGKETTFFNWHEEFAYPLKVLKKQFFGTKWSSNRLHGLVESEFFMNASDMKFFFGKNVKLMFMLRNPVNRLYSAYKMRLRQGQGSIIDLYGKHRKMDTKDLFHLYCEEVVNKNKSVYEEEFETGNYIKWLNQFQKEFPKQNMLILFLEDYKKDPVKEISKIEDFLGIEEKRLRTDKMENVGNEVSRNYYCSRLNGIFNLFYRKHNAYFVRYPDRGTKWIALRNRVYGYTLREETANMDENTKILCQKYYKKSVEELEAFMDRDLKELWF